MTKSTYNLSSEQKIFLEETISYSLFCKYNDLDDDYIVSILERGYYWDSERTMLNLLRSEYIKNEKSIK